LFQSLLGRLGDRLRVALTPSFLQSNSSSAGDNTALSSCDVEVSHQPFQKVSTQLIEVEVLTLVIIFLADGILSTRWHFTFCLLQNLWRWRPEVGTT